MEEILTKLLSDLALATLVGAMGSLGTTFLKGLFNSTNRWVNILITLLSVSVFSYLVTMYYSDLGMQTFLVINLYANVGAKGLYEAVGMFTNKEQVLSDESVQSWIRKEDQRNGKL